VPIQLVVTSVNDSDHTASIAYNEAFSVCYRFALGNRSILSGRFLDETTLQVSQRNPFVQNVGAVVTYVLSDGALEVARLDGVDLRTQLSTLRRQTPDEHRQGFRGTWSGEWSFPDGCIVTSSLTVTGVDPRTESASATYSQGSIRCLGLSGDSLTVPVTARFSNWKTLQVSARYIDSGRPIDIGATYFWSNGTLRGENGTYCYALRQRVNTLAPGAACFLPGAFVRTPGPTSARTR
jgi:hypothetical protein